MPIRRTPVPSRRRLLLLAGVFAVTALAGSLIPTPSEAAPDCDTELRFYSDASHTELIGIRGVTSEDCGCWLYYSGSPGGPHVVVVDSSKC